MESKYQLYQGDCLDFMRGMESVDAVITDPPYGIGEDGGLKARYRNGDGRTKGVAKYEKKSWDNTRPDKKVFDNFFELSDVIIIFGGNYFADLLPPSMGWMYWDKKMGGDFSDGELIYTNQNCALRSYSVHPFFELNGGKDREHPTQKPVSLMKWVIEQRTAVDDIIFDPFMGSGTTGVACMQLGRKFIGCELDPDYFAIAEKRIKAAASQEIMF